jgi:anti-sigma factor RsiW
MIRYDCEATRDLLPLRIRQELPPHEATAVDAHVSGCTACGAELALVQRLAAARPAVPAGLEQRVLLAVRRPAPRRWVPAGVGMAAVLAGLLIGGVLVLQRAGYEPAADPVPVSVVLENGTAPVVSWALPDDPLLHGGSTLQELSAEQLELILAELES